MASDPNEERAVHIADQSVLDSQGGGEMKDLADIQKGGPTAKLFMTFYSYGNTVMNATARAVGEANQQRTAASSARALGNLGLLYVMPALGTVALSRLLGKTGGDKDDWKDWLADVGKESLSTALNTMVLVRELQVLVGDGARGYAGPAGARLLQLVVNAGNQIKQGKADEAAVKSVLAVAGPVLHFPSAQLQRTIDGFVALEEGKTKNPMALLVGAPPKKKRR
jgi:hypothetical protein